MDSGASDATLPVQIGAHVELELIDDQGGREPLAVDIVQAQSADLAQGFLGANTPLAKAIRGQTAGSEVPYAHGRHPQCAHRARDALRRPSPRPMPKSAARPCCRRR